MLLRLGPMVAAFGAIFQAAPVLLAVPGIFADICEDIPIKIAPALLIGVHEDITAVTSSGVISSVGIK